MSGMTRLEGSLKGAHLDGISFSSVSTLHVPKAYVFGKNDAILEASSFHRDTATIHEFITRMCVGGLPFRSATRWGDGIISDDPYGLQLAIPIVQGNKEDKMCFRMKAFYDEENEDPAISDPSAAKPDILLRAELEFKTPLFYIFQLAELTFGKSDWNSATNPGLATTLIAGGADLFWAVASKHSLPLRGMNISMADATAIAHSINAQHADELDGQDYMELNAGSMVFESKERGYGYSYDESLIDNTPDLSVKFSSSQTHFSALLGHNLEGPSIAILQNIPISAFGTHNILEPIVSELMHVAATMRPALPLVHTI